MTFTKKQVYLTAFVLVLAIGFMVIRTGGKKEVDAAVAMKSGAKPPVPVRIAAVSPQRVEQKLVATGTVIANEEVELRSEISGRVTAINFQEGGTVRKGQLLVKLNDADLRANLRKLKLQEDLAESQEARAKKLVEQHLLSQEEYDAQLNRLMTVRADIDEVESNLAKTELHAPFDGIVGLRSVSVGSTVQNTTLIARLQQVNPVKVDFTVPEKYSSTIHPGTSLTFSVAGNDKEYHASVYALEPKIDLATRILKVRALSPNNDRALVPGSFAKVSITLQSIADAISVPSGTIVPELNGQKVYLLKNGKAISRKVTTGIRGDSTVQIVEGLAIGDTLITTGMLQLRDGAAVVTQHASSEIVKASATTTESRAATSSSK